LGKDLVILLTTKETIMKTYKFKEALKKLTNGGFIKEPSNCFSKHGTIYNKFGFCIGWITTDCYFEITEILGFANNMGLLKSGKRDEFAGSYEVYGYLTINGDFKYVDERKAA
jgi:hypothetical protein